METTPRPPAMTVFVCANCARPGQVLTSSGRARPVVPDFKWPTSVEQITVPCTGRLQPEHVLRAFESGSSLVSVIACREDNCHYIEGSRRCARRVDYIRSILNEIGLGGGRLLLFRLPGSASEDLALAAGRPLPEPDRNTPDGPIAALRDAALEALRTFPPNPLQPVFESAGALPLREATSGGDSRNE